MNERLIELLNSCKVARIPQLTKDTKSIIIEKSTDIVLKEDFCYRLKLPDRVVDVEIQKLDLDKVYCFSPLWEGWVDRKDITVIKEL